MSVPFSPPPSVPFYHILGIQLNLFVTVCITSRILWLKIAYIKVHPVMYYSMCFDKCVVMYLMPTTVQYSFINLKYSLWVAFVVIHSQPDKCWFVFHPYNLSFPECWINGIIQYVDFWIWHLWLSNMHLGFIHVVVWIYSFFPFITWSIHHLE